MKKYFLFLSVSLILFHVKAQFSANNIVVLRLGDSVSTLANTGNAIVLHQYTTAGNFLNMTFLPRTGTNAVTLSSTATSEGALTLSTDRTTLNFLAYRVTPPYSSSLASSTSSAVNRAVVSVNGAGVTLIPTVTAVSFSGNNPRGAISNGSGFYASGANTGIVYGTATSNIDTIVSNTSINNRNIEIFAGQLFFSTGSGTRGIWRVGNGTPANSGNVSTVYIATGNSSSPYDFDFNNDTNICYVADDRAASSGGGIQKWIRTGSTWNLAYTLSVGNNVGARNLTVNWNTPIPTIFATTAESARNRIVRIIDTGALSIPVTIDTAVANTIYRGIAFSPGSNPLPVTFGKFNARKTRENNVFLNWTTLTEINNSHFEVERSFDGENYETIGSIKAKGNSNHEIMYHYTDLNTQSAYYRIKQNDFDGQYSYSHVEYVSFDKFDVMVQPNPFNDLIEITNRNGEKLAVSIYDLNGKSEIELVSDEPIIRLETARINKGIYILKISNGTQVNVSKIVKN